MGHLLFQKGSLKSSITTSIDKRRRGRKYSTKRKSRKFLYQIDWPNWLEPNPKILSFPPPLRWSVRQRTLICICCVTLTPVMLQIISLHSLIILLLSLQVKEGWVMENGNKAITIRTKTNSCCFKKNSYGQDQLIICRTISISDGTLISSKDPVSPIHIVQGVACR